METIGKKKKNWDTVKSWNTEGRNETIECRTVSVSQKQAEETD